jgi:HK97 gp10 family phage protein
MRMRFNLDLDPRDLRRALGKLDGAASGRVLGRAVMAGALIVEGRAKELAPVDTGNLRASLQAELLAAGTRGAEAQVGTGVSYAAHQEFGTHRMPAHPFLRPALDESEQAVRRAVGDVVRRAVEGV